MKLRRVAAIAAVVAAGVLTVSEAPTTSAQNAAPGAEGQPPAQAPAPGRLVVLDFKPGLDDLMTMLVQPRHIRLYYAGEAENWKLAEFQADELRAGLARIGRTIPNYRNVNVDTAVASIFADRMTAVDTAIKAHDLKAFTTAFTEMTEACNDCHKGLEHPFLKIKVPEPGAFPNQDFRP